ncbi:hypothetical protein N0V82_003220 [Gnomoniopsis sp. IMI 355080]|nr:hypothetical protein N0V82_003220 [Gnomoniopsis sp. IMI 355080]
MHSQIPEFCPRPYGWGECQTLPGTFFLIMEFLYLINKRPSPEAISKVISYLHKRSSGSSLDGKFGFLVPNCHGKIVQPNHWDSNWSRYFTNLLTAFYNADMELNGPDTVYEQTFQALKQHVIPRLLKPLQADGHSLQPCLVHGDLWHQNIGLNEETDEPMIFDDSMFYGHNEYEIGMWRTVFIAFDESYRKQYLQYFPPSEPVDGWDDRNRLYSIPFNMTHSAGWLGAVKTTRPRYDHSRFSSSVTS